MVDMIHHHLLLVVGVLIIRLILLELKLLLLLEQGRIRTPRSLLTILIHGRSRLHLLLLLLLYLLLLLLLLSCRSCCKVRYRGILAVAQGSLTVGGDVGAGHLVDATLFLLIWNTMTWHVVASRALSHGVLVKCWRAHLTAGCLRKRVGSGVLLRSIAGAHPIYFMSALGSILLQFILLGLHEVPLHMWGVLLLSRGWSLILLPLLLVIHHAT